MGFLDENGCMVEIPGNIQKFIDAREEYWFNKMKDIDNACGKLLKKLDKQWLQSQADANHIEYLEKEFLLNVAEVTKLLNYYEHRLSNCIEPKFKKGDLVFANTVAYWENEKPIRHTTQQEIEDIVYFYKLKNYDFKNWDIDEIFSTEEEAKAKLEEIKNG